ncbi:MAG: hypothetical protein IPN34_21780 [Planctomycetes bacterium]|nr:hypothetical protein [Planctomycetota bacterium]
MDLDARWRARLERLEPDPVRRDLIVDRTVLLLLERFGAGRPPRDLERWFDRVAWNLWKSPRKIPRQAHAPLESVSSSLLADLSDLLDVEDDAEAEAEQTLRDWLLASLPVLEAHLSPRKMRVLQASLVAKTDYQAAELTGEQCANFGRALVEAGRRIRELIERRILPWPSCT